MNECDKPNLELMKMNNKTKMIKADLLGFALDFDFYFEEIFGFSNISVLITFQF